MKQCKHNLKEESSGLYKYCTKCPYIEWYDFKQKEKYDKVKSFTDKLGYYKSNLVQWETIKSKKKYDEYFTKSYVDNQIKVLSVFIEDLEKRLEEVKR